MSAQLKLDLDKVNFILSNKGVMKQCEIAKILNTSPTTVNQIIKGRRYSGMVNEDLLFDVDDFGKKYCY